MDIEDLMRQKRQIERTILDIIREFETTFGVMVDDITLLRMHEVGGTTKVHSVKVKVCI